METETYKDVLIDILPPFRPLLGVDGGYPDYDVADVSGGRDGAKSWGSVDCELILATNKPMKICEARETMSSIRDSSWATIRDALYRHEMTVGQNGPWEIQQSRFLRKDGERVLSEIMFIGVREDVRATKSLQNIDLTRFEEAGTASADSLEILKPTVLRKPGSKMWLIWNPELTSAPIYQWLRVGPASLSRQMLHIHTTYRDNAYLSDVSRRQIAEMKELHYAKYLHIYEGEPVNQVEGAIYGEEMKAAIADGRVGRYPIAKDKPIDWIWDIGQDTNIAIGCQFYNGYYHFVAEEWDKNTPITDIFIRTDRPGYVRGIDYLPHDSVAADQHKKSVQGAKLASGAAASPFDVVP